MYSCILFYNFYYYYILLYRNLHRSSLLSATKKIDQLKFIDCLNEAMVGDARGDVTAQLDSSFQSLIVDG